jgi:hypothetical protein
MIFQTASPYPALSFTRTDVAEKFSKPALLTAGNGVEPDYSKLALTDLAQAGEWRVQIPEIVATCERLPPPYVAPVEPPPAAVTVTAIPPERDDIGVL